MGTRSGLLQARSSAVPGLLNVPPRPAVTLSSPAQRLQAAPQHPRPILARAGGDGGSGSGSGGSGGSSGGSGGSGSEGAHPMRPWTFAFAVFLAVGGAMGYVKQGSTKSLGGGLSGALILALAARAMVGPGAAAGARVGLGVCALLAAFFVSRYARTKKVFPAGVGAGLSLGMVAGYVAGGL
eukprot:CAMPEP_0202858656 /NCGR_PEP_ID=MMETSP1391-20130828/1091_1 /ASSEMBLY_ACC=CAM_ASM_000867 /TAXON_ID=1034604 /ORGANISM="Chlamydomonas leiostraca, Strain SAG 11-49" /LENGTH=181 /DNA_ID=CAMNT_0049537591 /DNA_START=54 /DNA_END=599 /DNA_ORIENTATION=+